MKNKKRIDYQSGGWLLIEEELPEGKKRLNCVPEDFNMGSERSGYFRIQDVFEQLKRIMPKPGKDPKGQYRYLQWISTYNAINNIKPVDVASVIHAKWIYGMMSNHGDSCDIIECSNCRTDFVNTHDDRQFSYCPNCGAKMDLEKLEGN